MKIGIAIPCMDMVQTQFMASLIGLDKPEGSQVMIAQSSLIYDARDTLGRQAIDLECDRILWLDSDMKFEPDLLRRLSEDLDAGREFVTALYFTRKRPVEPVIFKSLKIETDEDGYITTKIDRYTTYLNDKCLFPIAACGFGACMMTTDLYKRVALKYGSPFTPLLGMGEDIAFCYRAQQVGAKLYCDQDIQVKHIGYYYYDEDDFINGG